MRIKSAICVGISLVLTGASLPAQDAYNPAKIPLPASDGSGPAFSLDQFGPVGTAAEAEATYQKASKAVIDAGGGVITIPTQTASDWTPKNNSQHAMRLPAPPASARTWKNGIGVTVVDARGVTPKIYPPQLSGVELDRVLNLPKDESLSFWGYFPMLSLRNTVLRGSTSYRDFMTESAPIGKDTKFYASTIRGIFPGMFMSCDEYGQVERLYVKTIGYDKEKQKWYFTADNQAFHPKGAIMGNKNHVSILDMETYSHNENQTFDVKMWRHNYSQGDNYLFDGRFFYQGDVHSTAGDENDVVYAAFISTDTGVFRGKVGSWNPTTQELKYTDAPSGGSTLGSGRPIINMNPAKWITNGTVLIVQPGSWTEANDSGENPVFEGKAYPSYVGNGKQGRMLIMGGLIRFSADAPISDAVIGRYFAVDEPGEYVPSTDLRRWYLIDGYTKNPDGTKDLQIIRHWWGAKTMNSPRLYKVDNSTFDGHIKPLHYIIAPGANAYDVSDGVSNPRVGISNTNCIIRIVPTSFTGTAADYAPGDPIEQAIGPDPFKPVPMRTWMWDQIPGAWPAPVFDVANNGQVMRDTALYIHGGGTDFADNVKRRYDQNPSWDRYLTFESTCNIGIKFAADVGRAAILFAQPNNREQPIAWYYGPTNAVPKVASLTVSRDSGDFSFSGGLVTKAGLSGGDKPARNLRGLNVAVKGGATTVSVAFPVAEADDKYGVFIEQTWLGNRAIVKKEAQGFTVQFEKPAPDGAKLDWMIVR